MQKVILSLLFLMGSQFLAAQPNESSKVNIKIHKVKIIKDDGFVVKGYIHHIADETIYLIKNKADIQRNTDAHCTACEQINYGEIRLLKIQKGAKTIAIMAGIGAGLALGGILVAHDGSLETGGGLIEGVLIFLGGAAILAGSGIAAIVHAIFSKNRTFNKLELYQGVLGTQETVILRRILKSNG